MCFLSNEWMFLMFICSTCILLVLRWLLCCVLSTARPSDEEPWASFNNWQTFVFRGKQWGDGSDWSPSVPRSIESVGIRIQSHSSSQLLTRFQEFSATLSKRNFALKRLCQSSVHYESSLQGWMSNGFLEDTRDQVWMASCAVQHVFQGLCLRVSTIRVLVVFLCNSIVI